jgi:hypothetical protein
MDRPAPAGIGNPAYCDRAGVAYFRRLTAAAG